MAPAIPAVPVASLPTSAHARSGKETWTHLAFHRFLIAFFSMRSCKVLAVIVLQTSLLALPEPSVFSLSFRSFNLSLRLIS